MTALATQPRTQVGRTLKTLIPLIQSELQQGNAAGREHYRHAGEMLIEAKDQLSHGSWTQWLTRNFELSQKQAQVYMRWAREHQKRVGDAHLQYRSLREMTGHTERDRDARTSKQHQEFRRIMRDIPRDDFVRERQARDDEVETRRALAAKLIDAGYRALATTLHPDRGGSKDAMSRLNRVRDELKQIAQTRRFV
jgi:hypothetical protein